MNSYDKKQNIKMGILMFVQVPNSTTLSKKLIFRSLPDRSNTIENSENRKKLDFWGFDLIDDRLIKKKKNRQH